MRWRIQNVFVYVPAILVDAKHSVIIASPECSKAVYCWSSTFTCSALGCTPLKSSFSCLFPVSQPRWPSIWNFPNNYLQCNDVNLEFQNFGGGGPRIPISGGGKDTGGREDWPRGSSGGADNAPPENDGQRKLGVWKMRDWKMTDKYYHCTTI